RSVLEPGSGLAEDAVEVGAADRALALGHATAVRLDDVALRLALLLALHAVELALVGLGALSHVLSLSFGHASGVGALGPRLQSPYARRAVLAGAREHERPACRAADPPVGPPVASPSSGGGSSSPRRIRSSSASSDPSPVSSSRPYRSAYPNGSSRSAPVGATSGWSQARSRAAWPCAASRAAQ